MNRTSPNFSFLAGPVDESKNQLPDILCVIQVSLAVSYITHMYLIDSRSKNGKLE